LISNGTFYYAEEIKENGTVIIYGPNDFRSVYIANELLVKLEKCASTKDVEQVIMTEWITH